MNRSILRAHPWTAALLAFSLVGVIVLGGATASQAAIWPKGFNPKQYMLNVLGSMLAGSNPDGKLGPAKQAIIQADQQYDHSWEGLEEQWKKSATGAPQTYEDYVIDRQKYFQDKGIKGVQGQLGTGENTGKGTKYVKPMKAPATKAQAFLRKGIGVGVGVGATVGWSYRADLGTAVGGLFGVDAAGAYCGNRDQFGAATSALDFITGQSCDAFAVDPEYVPNDDAKGGYSMTPVCYDGYCVKGLNGTVLKSVGSASIMHGFACFATSGSNNAGLYGFYDWRGKTYTNPITFDPDGYPACNNAYSEDLTPAYNQDKATAEGILGEIHWQCIAPKQPGGASPVDCMAAGASPLEQQSSNPERSFLCTYTLSDGSTVEKETDTFKETDKDVPSPVCPAVDPGDKSVKNVQVDEVNKENGTKQSVYDADTTGQYQDWWTKYPECREGACSLDLLKKNSTSATSCFASDRMNDACIDWMTDADKTANYQCMYGAHKVDLSECYVYANVFDPQKVLDGTAYADPATGDSVEGQSSPNAAQKALGRSWTDPQDFRGCLDNGWAKVNPIEWVMIPVQCSLQWAFAPSTQTVMTTTNAVVNDWASKAPGKIANAVSSWSITAPGGCDIPVTVLGTKVNLSPACPGQPLAGVAMLSKIATTAVVCVLCFFACRRIVRSWIGDSDAGDGGGER